MKVLIAGGAGYIGSTIASALLDAGHVPLILDNFSTGRREFCRDRITYEGDYSDGPLLDRIFSEHPDIWATIHCGALIIVSESIKDPIRYYRENVCKTLALVDRLMTLGARRLIFSSSASIYAPSVDFTVNEDSQLLPMSPYARSKAIVETMLNDVAVGGAIDVVSLRYFNPIGADPALRSGSPAPTPTHALGSLIAAFHSGSPFIVNGTDYPTRDGSGIRDYIHVWDLARAHVDTLERFDFLFKDRNGSTLPINLGTGRGTTVFELALSFNEVVGDGVTIRPGPRRPGDTVGAFSVSNRAFELLGWTTEYSIHDGISHSLDWTARQGVDTLTVGCL